MEEEGGVGTYPQYTKHGLEYWTDRDTYRTYFLHVKPHYRTEHGVTILLFTEMEKWYFKFDSDRNCVITEVEQIKSRLKK